MDKKMEEKDVQRDPAPAETSKPKGKKNRWLYIVIGAAIAATSFVGGFCTRWFTIEKDMRTLINVKNKIDKEYYEDISDEEFYDAVFGAVNNQVLDRYSRYISADDYRQEKASNQGKRSGLGLIFYGTAYDEALRTVIYRVSGNSPAEKAGFRAGDRLTGFGTSENAIVDCDSFDDFSAFLNEIEDKTTFYVRVQRGDESLILSVACENYVESYVFYKSNTTSYTVTGDGEEDVTEIGQPLTCLDDDTAYIRLIQFTGEADELFKVGLELFEKQGKKNLVLDLRGNGGGDMKILQNIGAYFCKDAKTDEPLIALADYGERTEKFKADDNEYYEYFSADSRICVIADNGTASASEALMGAMLDYNTVDYGDICLIEENGVAKTYGKGIMQTTYIMDLIEQDALRLTTARILWPESGTCIHDRGILSSDGDGTKTTAKNYNADEELIAAINALFS